MTKEEWKLSYFLLEKYTGINVDINWEIDHCILSTLPITEQLRALDMFVNRGERLFHIAEDFSKLVYKLWEKYMVKEGKPVLYQDRPKVYPHEDFYEYLYTIKTQLELFVDSTPVSCLNKKGTRYVFWHICGLYPLLGEKGLEMLVKVCQKRYEDAQDMMMFAIYQLDPKNCMEYIKRIFRGWSENKNILLKEGGTGCWGELDTILSKWKRIGYKPDKEFRKILLDSGLWFDQDTYKTHLV